MDYEYRVVDLRTGEELLPLSTYAAALAVQQEQFVSRNHMQIEVVRDDESVIFSESGGMYAVVR